MGWLWTSVPPGRSSSRIIGETGSRNPNVSVGWFITCSARSDRDYDARRTIPLRCIGSFMIGLDCDRRVINLRSRRGGILIPAPNDQGLAPVAMNIGSPGTIFEPYHW